MEPLFNSPGTDVMLYDAWCVIANAPGWDEDTEWRRAAIRWRDAWHATLPSEATIHTVGRGLEA